MIFFFYFYIMRDDPWISKKIIFLFCFCLFFIFLFYFVRLFFSIDTFSGKDKELLVRKTRDYYRRKITRPEVLNSYDIGSIRYIAWYEYSWNSRSARFSRFCWQQRQRWCIDRSNLGLTLRVDVIKSLCIKFKHI